MKYKSYIWFLSQPPLPALMLVAALAWLLLWFSGNEHAAHQVSSVTMETQLMHHHVATLTEQLNPPFQTVLATFEQLSHWAIMILAMMFPLLYSAIRHICQRSLPRLRLLGSVLFCMGYIVLWLLVGYLMNIGLVYTYNIPNWQIAVGAILVVLFWQASPWKQWALNWEEG